MFSIVCFLIALIIVAVFAFGAYTKRSSMSETISCILIGIFLSTFFMVLPTQWVKADKAVFCEPLYTVLSSLLYSLKALGGRQDIAQLETIALPGFFKAVYIGLNYICFALAPILASSLILSFIGDTGEKMRLFLRFSPKCYIFSEINENALALADGIKNKPGKKTIVFCNAKNTNKDLIAKAKKLDAIVLHKPCSSLKISKRFDVFEFCLISDDEDSNLRLAEVLIARHADTQKAKILINTFVESGTNVNFLESVIKSKGKNTNIELRCVDEIALFCNHLIYNHPLYNTNGSNNISVAIVGCGRTGMRMLKTAYWAGQIDGYSLKIRVYDQAADACREDFYRQCPGLKNEETIKFVTADVGSAAFEEQLLSPENSADATYIVVAMGNDRLNLSVSDTLYRIYRRHFAFRDARIPNIFTRVRSQAKSKPYFDNAGFLEDRHIHLFGTTASVFSDKTLFDTELENLAFAVHLAYRDGLDLDKNTGKYAQIRRDFQTSEYDRRSSMAVALHIPAKLCMCGRIPKTCESTLTPENLQIYAECVANDADLRSRLAINEHSRWTAFMLSEGYQAATVEQMHKYAEAVDSHKDDLSMLHPCITDWEALDELENIYNSTYNKQKKFKKYDKEIVEKVPRIWAVAQQMNGEN